MKRSLLAIVLALPSLALAKGAAKPAAPLANVDRSQTPPTGPAPKIVIPAPVRFKLANGTQVLVVERHKLPMADIALVWPVGATVEPAARLGLHGFMVSLLHEGTTTRDATKLAAELEGLGTRFDTTSSWDASVVSMTTLARNLPASLELLGDVVQHPAFDAKELDKTRTERLTAIVQQRDAASIIASNVFGSALYGGKHRYGTPLIGDEASLKAVTRDDVLAEFAKLRPEEATLIICGDVKPDTLKPLLEKTFAGWVASGPASKSTPIDLAPPQQKAQLIVVDRPSAPQSEVRIGHPSVPRSTPDYFPLLVANTIFGGTFNSRLNTNLREKHGYTYGARSAFHMRRDGGPFEIGAPVKTDTTQPSLKESLAELDLLRSAPPTDEELRRAKDLLERALARRFEKDGDVVNELGNLVVFKLPDDYLSTYAAKVEAVTGADVLRVAKQHLDPSQLTIVVVGDRKVASDAQAALKLPPIELRDTAGHLIVEMPAPPAAMPATPAKPAAAPAGKK